MCVSVYKCVHMILCVILVRGASPLRGTEKWVVVSRGGFMVPYGGCRTVLATALILHQKITSLCWRC